jgi:hypothetical protein
MEQYFVMGFFVVAIGAILLRAYFNYEDRKELETLDTMDRSK